MKKNIKAIILILVLFMSFTGSLKASTYTEEEFKNATYDTCTTSNDNNKYELVDSVSFRYSYFDPECGYNQDLTMHMIYTHENKHKPNKEQYTWTIKFNIGRYDAGKDSAQKDGIASGGNVFYLFGKKNKHDGSLWSGRKVEGIQYFNLYPLRYYDDRTGYTFNIEVNDWLKILMLQKNRKCYYKSGLSSNDFTITCEEKNCKIKLATDSEKMVDLLWQTAGASAPKTSDVDYNYGNISDKVGFCVDYLGHAKEKGSTANFLDKIFTLVKVGAILLSVILTMFDLAGVITSDKAELNKVIGKGVRRIVIVIVLLLLPTLIEIIFGLFGYQDVLCGIR